MAETFLTIEFDRQTYDRVDSAYDEVFRDMESKANQALPQIKKELKSTLLLIMRKLNKMHGQAWRPDRGANKKNLYKRSGEGLRDIKTTIEVSGGTLAELRGIIDPVGYIERHEQGGETRTSKYMTIPLPAALDSRGVPLRRSARDWDRTFVHRSRKGSLLIFQRRGRRIVPLYVLQKKITHRPRLRLQETFDKEIPYFEKRAFEHIAKALAL